MSELVSVCMPTYNGAKYLHDSVMSVLSQTYQNLEILIVDDASTDSTLEVVNNLQQMDPRIRVVSNPSTLGLVSNWNNCLKLALGSWVKFHFQDDLMKPTAIEEMMAQLTQTQCRVVLSDRAYLTSNPNRAAFFSKLTTLAKIVPPGTNRITPGEMATLLVRHGVQDNFLGEPIVGLFHKEVVNDHGAFDTGYDQISDFEFWLRVALSEPIAFIQKKLVTFRVHDQSASSANKKMKGISPSLLDRLRLAEAFQGVPEYGRLPDLVGREARDQLVKHIVVTNVRKIGLYKVLRYRRWEQILYFMRWPFAILLGSKTS